MADTSPTRMALLQRRTQLGLARKGVDLLEKKRDALIAEFFGLVRKALAARKRPVKLTWLCSWLRLSTALIPWRLWRLPCPCKMFQPGLTMSGAPMSLIWKLIGQTLWPPAL